MILSTHSPQVLGCPEEFCPDWPDKLLQFVTGSSKVPLQVSSFLCPVEWGWMSLSAPEESSWVARVTSGMSPSSPLCLAVITCQYPKCQNREKLHQLCISKVYAILMKLSKFTQFLPTNFYNKKLALKNPFFASLLSTFTLF